MRNVLLASASAMLVVTPLAIPRPVTIPFTRGPAHLRTIRVQVGTDSADYLFDTGGGVTVISPRDSASLGCTPGGRSFGVRLTGEVLTGRACANVTLGVGPFQLTGDVGVMDLGRMLGPHAPPVRGMISLSAFAEHAITLDLAHEQMIVETPGSLAARVRDMTPVPMRLATGEHGGQLTVFVGVRARSGAMLWLEWDSENNASTLLTPQAIAMLGGDTTRRTLDLPLTVAPGLETVVPVMSKSDMIHDGVLSAGFIERAVWTVDLEHGRMWVGPVTPILTLPDGGQAAAPTPPVRDPVGLYRSTTYVAGHARLGVMEVKREAGRLVASRRELGEDDAHELFDMSMRGDTISYMLHLPDAVPVQAVFQGVTAHGVWGDGGVKRGGAVELVKVR